MQISPFRKLLLCPASIPPEGADALPEGAAMRPLFEGDAALLHGMKRCAVDCLNAVLYK
jgi:hypothetical protein